MKYIVDTDKSVEQAVADVEAAAQDHTFGVLHIHNLQQTMKNDLYLDNHRVNYQTSLEVY